MILDTIAASTLERVAAAKEALPLAEQIARARDLDSNTGFPFEQALAKQGMSFICEVKKASPSKGLIAAEFPYVQIAREYEAAGADAISVLTEPAYFQGKNEYLTEIRQAVKIPLLRTAIGTTRTAVTIDLPLPMTRIDTVWKTHTTKRGCERDLR